MKPLNVLLACVASVGLMGPSMAQDKAPAKDAPKPATPAAKPADAKPAAPAAKPADAKPAAAAPGAEGMQIPPEAIAAMTPGEMHAKLKPMDGKWTFVIKMWMEGPDSTPMESKGTAAFHWIMDGRILQLDIDSPEGPMGPFKGLGFMGYDNTKKMYHSTWYDNGNTAAMTMTGQWDASGKTLVWKGENYDIFEGRNVQMRTEMTVTDATTMKEVAYAKDADGKESKVMELTYTRAK